VKAYCDFFSALVQVRTVFGSYPIQALPRQSFYVGTASNWQYSSAINVFSNKRTRLDERGEARAQPVPLDLEKLFLVIFCRLSTT
jgi:hypothetical protein